MANTITNPQIESYVESHTSQGPKYLHEIAERTHIDLGERARMLTGHVEGRFLKFLVSMLKPEKILEIGCFTGYSALCMAEGLSKNGRITTCDISEEHAQIAKSNFQASQYADQINLILGPALITLETLEGPYDFIFVDADKENYLRYYETVLPLLSKNGIIAFDNVLWSGQVLQVEDQTEETKAIQELNDYLIKDDRIECVMLPVRDGITLIRSKGSTDRL